MILLIAPFLSCISLVFPDSTLFEFPPVSLARHFQALLPIPLSDGIHQVSIQGPLLFSSYSLSLSVHVCFCYSITISCLTLCHHMDCSMPGIPVLLYHAELAQTRVHWVDYANHLILCRHPLLLLPSVFPSVRVFSNESALHIRWPNFQTSASALVLSVNIQFDFI